MSETHPAGQDHQTNPVAVSPQPEPPRSPLQHLVGVFVEPRAEFAEILRRPGRWWMAVLVTVVLNLAFTAVWMQKVDKHQFIRTQIEESGRADKIPADRMETVVDQQARFMGVFAWVGAVVFPFVGALVLGAVFLFVYRFFYGAELSFMQSLAVVSWSFAALAVITVPLLLAVFAAKGDWNANPQSALQANLSLLLEKGSVSRALYSLAESIDLFAGWVIFLLASGFGVAARKPTAGAIWGVVIPWAIWVLGKVGLVALMS